MRRVLRNFPGVASTMPRLSAVCSMPAKLTAVRCPGMARSTAFPPDSTPRTRSRLPAGSNATSSPAPTVPETSVPVTTDPNPFIANARSIGKRKYPDPSRIATLDAAWRKAFFKSSSPARVLALTAIIGASSRNDPRKYSWASSRTNSSVSVSTRSLLVSATTPRLTPSRRQISKCSRVCGLMDSSAATTSSSTSIPAAPASMLLTNRSCPGTSTKPKRTSFSSRKAKPRSMVMPRRFSSSSGSGCVPVSASTNADLPWSMCPAVPMMTLCVAAVCVAVGMVVLRQSFPLWMLLEERLRGQTSRLFCGGDFVDDGLRGGAGIGGRKNRPAHHQKISARANRFFGRCFARLIVGGGFHRGIFRAHAGSDDQEISPARFTNRLGFLDGSNHAVHTGFFRKLRELDHARLRRAANADFLHGLLIHARENRDRQQARPVRAHGHSGADGLRRSLHHGFAAERVHAHELHAGHGCSGEHRSGNGIRDVMVFQVEEHAGAQRGDFFYRGGTGSGKKLIADLEHTDKIGNLRGKFHRGR